jgi:hypothetical protein
MNRRQMLAKFAAARVSILDADPATRSSDRTYTGPPGGSRGTQLVAVLSGPFNTAGNPSGL